MDGLHIEHLPLRARYCGMKEESITNEQGVFVYSSKASSNTTTSSISLQREPVPGLDSAVSCMNQHILSTANTLTNLSPLTKSATFPQIPTNVVTISTRRGMGLNLPRFDELFGTVVASQTNATHAVHGLENPNDRRPTMLVKAASMQQVVQSESLAPPTPPHDTELTPWLRDTNEEPSRMKEHSTSEVSESLSTGSTQSSDQVVIQDHALSNYDLTDISPLDFAQSPWFLRVMQTVGEICESNKSSVSTKLISQVLPPNANDLRHIKTYEMICDYLQQISHEPRPISIHHALTKASGQTGEDFPRSPPVTPSILGDDGYFGDQIMFTHVAQVPGYHEVRQPASDSAIPPQRHLMAAEANVIVLERYIPPTTAAEIEDFFNANSCRSYLADRLPELAVDSGSLILIYPTKKGAETFARRYAGPVLDPLLREMSILQGLNTHAAEMLGSLDSVEAMYDFEQMTRKVQGFCASLNSRASTQRSRSEFAVCHLETSNIVLDRNTWLDWFIDQEQLRMKRNLIDYHRDGGRLPGRSRTKSEVTAGMLGRDIAEGMRKSTKPAGDVGIEVGVFVIRRRRKEAAQA